MTISLPATKNATSISSTTNDFIIAWIMFKRVNSSISLLSFARFNLNCGLLHVLRPFYTFQRRDLVLKMKRKTIDDKSILESRVERVEIIRLNRNRLTFVCLK